MWPCLNAAYVSLRVSSFSEVLFMRVVSYAKWAFMDSSMK